MIAQGLLILALCAGVSAGVAGIYMQGKKAGKAEVEATDARERQIAQAATDAALKVTAEAIGKIRVRNTTIQSEVQREISERVVYRDCQHSPEQLRRINEAITGVGTEPAGSGLLPPAVSTGRADLRRDDDKAGGSSGAVQGVPRGGAD